MSSTTALNALKFALHCVDAAIRITTAGAHARFIGIAEHVVVWSACVYVYVYVIETVI
jgi:hypothetical protein